MLRLRFLPANNARHRMGQNAPVHDANSPLFAASKLRKHYGDQVVVDDLSFHIDAGRTRAPSRRSSAW